jgi:hypothetical protein
MKPVENCQNRNSRFSNFVNYYGKIENSQDMNKISIIN